jgi:hypothetical protein
MRWHSCGREQVTEADYNRGGLELHDVLVTKGLYTHYCNNGARGVELELDVAAQTGGGWSGPLPRKRFCQIVQSKQRV